MALRCATCECVARGFGVSCRTHGPINAELTYVVRPFDIAHLTAHDRHEIPGQPGYLGQFVEWTHGMDWEYRHVPSQPCDPLLAMEQECRWQCTQPRQNLRHSFDKRKYYNPGRFYKDTGIARQMDGSGHRDRTLQRFCDALWRKNRPPTGEISLTHRDIRRLLERVGLEDSYHVGGFAGIAERVGMTRRQRDAFVLWPTLNQEQIAAELHITQAAVSQRLANAVARCRKWARTQNLISLPLSIDGGLAADKGFSSVANF